MKTINSLFIFMVLLSLTACAGQHKQCKLEATAQPKAVEKKEAVASTETVKAQEAVKPVEKPAPATVYIVKKSDTLEKIAKLPTVYGDRNMWPVLFEANRNQLSHPSKIYPGQRLRIPRDVNEISILKKRARLGKVRETADQASRELKLAKEQQRAAAKASQAASSVATATTPSTPAVAPVSVPTTETVATPPTPAAAPSTMTLPVIPAEPQPTTTSESTNLQVEQEGSQASGAGTQDSGTTAQGSIS